MDDRFVALATYIRATPASTPPATGQPESVPLSLQAKIETLNGVAQSNVVAARVDFAHADIVHDLTLMRLAALEGFERATRRLIADLAHDVLARELALAPADIEALVARALAAWSDHEPIALAVAPADRERVRAPLPIRTDPTLASGDLTVFVRDGAFESPFGFRLADALERNALHGAA